MFFIGGISSGVKPLEYLKTVICGRCGAYGRYQVYMTYMYFSFFFIPIFKWNRRFFVEMSCCGAVYELDPDCLLYTSPSPRDRQKSRMPSSA